MPTRQQNRLILRSASRASYLQQVLAALSANLLVYWPLDDASGAVVRDASTNGRNGALKGIGEPLLGQPGIGDGGTAALFDGTNDYVNIYTTGFASAFSGAAGTISLWVKATTGVWADATIRYLVGVLVDTNNRIYIRKSNASQLVFLRAGSANSKSTSVAVPSDSNWHHVALTWDATAGTQKAYIDGLQVGTTLTSLGAWVGSLAAGQCTLGTADIAGNNPWSGSLAHAAVWNASLNETRIAYLANRSRFVVCDGDSHTQGTGGNTPYPMLVQAQLGTSWGLVNYGVSGQTLLDMQSDAATQIDPLWFSSTRPIVIAWGGHNDIAGGADSATTHQRLANYCLARKAAGFPVAVCTLIANGAVSRKPINALIRANYTSYADRLIDLGADSHIGEDANPADTTYFQVDQSHLTTAGNMIVSAIATPVVQTL